MVFFLISVLAGVLTILAPCILPLLPIVLGTSEGAVRGISGRSVRVIGSLAVSVIIFTLLLKASTLLIMIPQSVWAYISGTIITLVGLSMVSPRYWSSLPFVSKINRASNTTIGSGYQRNSSAGDFLIGLALGPVFTTCSPTYFFIIATALPASFIVGLVYLFGFVLGLVVALLLVAFFGQRLISLFTKNATTTDTIKKAFGILIILVGIAIFTGYDKVIETKILDSGYGATINFENGLLDAFRE